MILAVILCLPVFLQAVADKNFDAKLIVELLKLLDSVQLAPHLALIPFLCNALGQLLGPIFFPPVLWCQVTCSVPVARNKNSWLFLLLSSLLSLSFVHIQRFQTQFCTQFVCLIY